MLELEFPQIITFYSYKGGVGRSMAMMNVAYTLASWGRHVLMVDMDLEAPGISGFLERSGELEPGIPGLRDLLSLLAETKRLSSKGLDAEVLAEKLAPLSSFIRSVKAGRLERLKPEMGRVGRLDLLGPNLGGNYEDRLAELDLQACEQEQLVAISRILHFYLKGHKFDFQPEWRKEIGPSFPISYDYILIDSRTGFTEIGGLCVGPLADRLVVLTGLNDQNIEGTRRFLATTGIHHVGPNDGILDRSAPGENSLGPKPTLIVASPVPVGELTHRKSRITELIRALGVRPSKLSYHPQLALWETVFVRDYPDEYLSLEYRVLAERMVTSIGDVPQIAMPILTEPGDTLEPSVRSKVIELCGRYAPQNPELIISYLWNLGSTLHNASTRRDYLDAISVNSILTLSKLSRFGALNNLGNLYSSLARLESGGEAGRLFGLASEKYEEAIRIQPESAMVYCNWGDALGEQAQHTRGEEALNLYTLATEKYQEAIRLEPDSDITFMNWGVALSRQAQSVGGESARSLYNLASEKFQEAARLRPASAQALWNWGMLLIDQARREDGAESVRLSALGLEKLQEAGRINPEMQDKLNGWLATQPEPDIP